MRRYTKKPLTIDEQLCLLKGRGLHFKSDTYATKILRRISYYRLANYWKVLEEDKENHKFKDGASFHMAVTMYNFDSELRHLIFSYIQPVEITLRTLLIHRVSLRYGAFWFMNKDVFCDEDIFKACLKNIKSELKRSKEDFIISHSKCYNYPKYPPVWKTLEVVSFGTLSKLYANLRDTDLKKEIAKELGLPQHLFLESWITSLAVLRNCCAHHARTWNRVYSIKPQMAKSLKYNWITKDNFQANKLYPILCCISYLNSRIDIGKPFPSLLKKLISKYPTIDIAAMGFPKNWNEEPLWK